jgi:hypothetical protein
MTAITIDGRLLNVITEKVYGCATGGDYENTMKRNLRVIHKYLEEELGEMFKDVNGVEFTYVPDSDRKRCGMSGILVVNNICFAFKSMSLTNLTMGAYSYLHDVKRF